MWLRLGDGELINLAFAISIKKGDESTILIQMSGEGGRKVLPFPTEPHRDHTFEKLVENLSRLRLALK